MPETTQSDLVERDEVQMSAREHPGISEDILREAIKLALQRGGQTTPVSDYDILRARDMIAGEQSEVTRLTSELHAAKETAARLRAHCEALDRFHTPRTLDQWSDDYGDVLWHLMPICQPPWVGTPQDTDWPFAVEDDARLWWTRLPDCNQIHKRWKENAS